MPFHGETFWATVGAVAPVIALAGVVAVPEVLRSFDRFQRPSDKIPPNFLRPGFARWGMLLSFGQAVLTALAIGISVYALNGALRSLASSRDYISVASAIGNETFALWALLIAAVLNAWTRLLSRRLEAELKRIEAKLESAAQPKQRKREAKDPLREAAEPPEPPPSP